MALDKAILKTSAVPARRFALRRRGTTATGNWVDLRAYDLAAFVPKSSYSSPAEPPEGICMVLANGEISVEKGRPTGVPPCLRLRHVHSWVTGSVRTPPGDGMQ